MRDNSSTDKMELIVDYILSWTLRCATGHYEMTETTDKKEKAYKKKTNTILQEYTVLISRKR